MPPLTLGEIETASPLTPLGAKGCGDGSVAPAPVAIANAAADALRPLGIAVDALPLEPAAVWAAIASDTGTLSAHAPATLGLTIGEALERAASTSRIGHRPGGR